MSARGPTTSFGAVSLDVARVQKGRMFGRIYLGRHPDPLGFGKAKSRFSDPRRRKPEHRFGVLYMGQSLKVCFAEAVLRDLRNGAVGDYPVHETELHALNYARIEVSQTLRLVELRGDGPIRMGIPSDVIGASNQSLARAWSVAIHAHPAAPDGMIYPSRLNEETNVVVYDRAVFKLRAARVTKVIDAPELPAVLDDLKVALV